MAHDSLYAALAALQASLPRVGKDAAAIVPTKNGGSYGYKYADLAAITRELFPRLASCGLSFTAIPDILSDKWMLRCVLAHESGEHLTGWYPLPGGVTAQQQGSAITYARRYALCAMTGLAPDEDDDDGQAAAGPEVLREMRRLPPEVDVHGAATEAEQVRMVTGPEPGAWRSDGTAENDPFYVRPPEDAERSRAMRGMFALWKELGVSDKEVMLAEITGLLGRPVASRADLSLPEVTVINAMLRKRKEAAS